MTPPSRATVDGRAYLGLRGKARAEQRPVDELLQFYVLECFLARLAESDYVDRFVLKGGVLLAALGERRPTRDIDLLVQDHDNDPGAVQHSISQITRIGLDDGVVFEHETGRAALIRDSDIYPGVRITMDTRLASARPQFHVDVNVGDPAVPPPGHVTIPRLLGGELTVRGYSLSMVHAEKIVTAVARGTTSTRWRDFADIYLLVGRHPVDGDQLIESVRTVARHRGVELTELGQILGGFGTLSQGKWTVWRRRQALENRLPGQFDDVLSVILRFADPVISGSAAEHVWNPETRSWSDGTVSSETVADWRHESEEPRTTARPGPEEAPGLPQDQCASPAAGAAAGRDG